MPTNPTHHRRPSFPSCVAVLALLAACGGCKPHEGGGSHAHGAEPGKAGGAKEAGHDHDHDHDHDHGDDHGAGEGEAHADEVTLTPEAVIRYGIKVDAATLSTLTPTFTAPGRVGFNTEAMAHVGSPLRGRAVEIRARLGDAVKRGDALLIVESPELGEAQAEYFQRRTAAQASAPSADLARLSWERAKALFEQSQGISLSEVQKREAEYKAAVASQRSAEAAVIGSENRLHLLGMGQAAVEDLARTGEIAPRYTVHAPIDGRVVQREITLGELVGPDREALMVLADTSTLWVLADVPEARVHEAAVGARAWVAAGASDGRRFEGAVSFVAALVDPDTRTAQVRIEVPAAALALRPGMFALVEIVAADPDAPGRRPVVAVPDAAVQTVEGGPAVFVPVKGEPNTFAKRAVTVGPAVGGLVPVLSGLAEGEEFVSAGAFILKADLGKSGAAHQH